MTVPLTKVSNHILVLQILIVLDTHTHTHTQIFHENPHFVSVKQALRGSLPWWSEGSCRTADHVCEFVNRFPADRRKVEVSLFFVVFETACGFMGRAHRSARLVICCHPP